MIELDQRPDGRFDITWKQPGVEGYGVRLEPHISGGLIDRAPDVEHDTEAFELKQWRGVVAPAGLQGYDLRVDGLDRTITDVFVSIRTSDGEARHQVLKPNDRAVPLTAGTSGLAVHAYLLLGIKHILTGYDHLAFVLGLMLLVPSRSMLLKTITAFTFAHSVTLALTAMRIVTVQSALIESLVALSIAFLAAEVIARDRGRPGLGARRPWLIAFGFGLLHGCAFAGALAEVGLPANEALPALFLFNLGLEAGQLLFIGATSLIALLLARWSELLPLQPRSLLPHAIGSMSAFWFVVRFSAILTGQA